MAGALAQLVERLVRNEKVRGSTPLSSTKTFLLPILYLARFISCPHSFISVERRVILLR
jgi:hypothetical protein